MLFRNVLLPDGKGDIDAVLMGPKGIFVLEVKTYSGYTRNIGQSWQRKALGGWRTTSRPFTGVFQPLQNCAVGSPLRYEETLDLAVSPAGCILLLTRSRIKEPADGTGPAGAYVNKNLPDLLTAVGIAAAYFGATYFAVAALFPELALNAALLALILSLLVYRFLRMTAGDEEVLPFGLLLLLPFV